MPPISPESETSQTALDRRRLLQRSLLGAAIGVAAPTVLGSVLAPASAASCATIDMSFFVSGTGVTTSPGNGWSSAVTAGTGTAAGDAGFKASFTTGTATLNQVHVVTKNTTSITSAYRVAATKSVTLVAGVTYLFSFQMLANTSSPANQALQVSIGTAFIAYGTLESTPAATRLEPNTIKNGSLSFTPPTSGTYTFTYQHVNAFSGAGALVNDDVAVTFPTVTCTPP